MTGKAKFDVMGFESAPYVEERRCDILHDAIVIFIPEALQ